MKKLDAFQSYRRKNNPVFKVPDSVQESIPVNRIHKNGVFELEHNGREKTYDKAYVISDINYSDKDEQEKDAFLLSYCDLLNLFQTNTKIQIINTPQTEQFEKQLFLDLEGREGYDRDLANAYNEIFRKQLEVGSNGLSTVKLLIVTCTRESFEDAISFFSSIEIEMEEHFRQLSSGMVALTAQERLRYMHAMYNMDKTGEFHLNWGALSSDINWADWKNDVCAELTDPKSKYLVFDGQFASTLYIKNYPNSVKDTFIKKLSAIPCCSAITLDLSPIPKDVAATKLSEISMGIEDSIQRQQRERNKIGAFTTDISFKKRQEKKAIEKYLTNMGDNDANLFYSQILITVYGKDKKELERHVRTVQGECRTNQFQAKQCLEQQLEAFQTALPTGGRYVDYLRPLFTQPLAGFVPFNAREIQQVGGKVYGYNRVSKKMVMANRKLLMNGNGMVLAMPGAGKSVTEKWEMGQVYLEGLDDMIIIDPQNEYFDIAQKWGGQIIDFAVGTKYHINPFELPEDRECDYEKFISQIGEFTMTLIESIMAESLTQYHKAVVEKVVRRMYQEAQCKKEWKSPTMYDFKRILDSLEERYQMFAEEISIVLEPFTEGSLNIFAHPTDVRMDSRMVVFGLGKLAENLRRPAMLIMLHLIERRVKENHVKRIATWIWADEFHILVELPSVARSVEQIFKTYRKFGGIPTGITQNISDLLRTKETKTMVANCEYLCLLKTEGIDRRELASILQLSEAQLKYITNNARGTGLLKFGEDIVGFNNVLDEENMLYQLYNTNMHEKKGKGDECA